MGLEHNTLSAKLHYHATALEVRQREESGGEEVEKALERLEALGMAFYDIDQEQGRNADPNLLFS